VRKPCSEHKGQRRIVEQFAKPFAVSERYTVEFILIRNSESASHELIALEGWVKFKFNKGDLKFIFVGVFLLFFG